MQVPTDLLYTDQHEWCKVDGDIVTVGVTQFAQEQLGDLTFIELPEEGKKLTKGAEAVALESCKAAASVYAPADGVVTESNEALADDPGLVNTDPYGEGWIFRFKVSDTGRMSDLMTPEKYDEMLTAQG